MAVKTANGELEVKEQARREEVVDAATLAVECLREACKTVGQRGEKGAAKRARAALTRLLKAAMGRKPEQHEVDAILGGSDA